MAGKVVNSKVAGTLFRIRSSVFKTHSSVIGSKQTGVQYSNRIAEMTAKHARPTRAFWWWAEMICIMFKTCTYISNSPRQACSDWIKYGLVWCSQHARAFTQQHRASIQLNKGLVSMFNAHACTNSNPGRACGSHIKWLTKRPVDARWHHQLFKTDVQHSWR